VEFGTHPIPNYALTSLTSVCQGRSLRSRLTIDMLNGYLVLDGSSLQVYVCMLKRVDVEIGSYHRNNLY